MNTFAMNPAVRPPLETQAGRGLPEAAETSDAGGNPFGAVLGALTRPPSQPQTVATATAAPDEPVAAGGNPSDPADPLGLLAVPTPVEPTRKTGQDAFDALVARAIPERPPGRGGKSATGDAAHASDPIVVPASADRPSTGRTEADGDPPEADPRGADASGPVPPDPASRAGLTVTALILPAPDPEREAPQAAPSAPASPLASAAPGPLPQAASEARMRATVLRQETHFAPVMPRSVRLPGGEPAAAGSPAAVRDTSSGAFPDAVQAMGSAKPASPENLADVPDRPAPVAAGAEFGTEAVSRNAPGLWAGAAADRTISTASAPVLSDVAKAIVASDAESTVRSPRSEDPDAFTKQVAFDGAKAPAPASAAPAFAAAKTAAPGLPAADPIASAAITATAAPAAIPTAPVRTGEPVGASAIEPEIAPHPAVLTPFAKGEVAPGEHDGVAGSRHESVSPQGSNAVVSPVPANVTLSPATSAGSFGSPVAQIAEAVATEAQRMAAAPPGAPANLVAADGPLRILTLQLRPMDLGNVVVRMRLRGSQLEMSLHASREDTAELLRKDGVLLGTLLRDAGYQPDAVTIGAPMPEASSGNAPASGQTFQPGSGGQNPARDMSDQPARRQPEAGTARTTETRERTNETNSGSPDRSGVYL